MRAWCGPEDWRGPEIEPGTWLVCEPDCDVPVPHHLFREDELRAVWKGFLVMDLERNEYARVGESGQPKLSAHWEVWAERV